MLAVRRGASMMMQAPALGDTVLINIERRRPAPQPLFAFLPCNFYSQAGRTLCGIDSIPTVDYAAAPRGYFMPPVPRIGSTMLADPPRPWLRTAKIYSIIEVKLLVPGYG